MIKYRQEFLDSVKTDSIGLIREHFAEVYPSRNVFDLDMDWDTYGTLQDLGRLRIFTARDGDKLIGYLWVVISPSLHAKGEQIPCEDGWFVSKGYRGRGVSKYLLSFGEKCLKEDGFKVLHMVASEDNNLDTVMDKCGYKKIETKFEKVI